MKNLNDFLNKVIHGDAFVVLKQIPKNSIDVIITDPPYGLGFMNQEWDNPEKQLKLIRREIERSKRRYMEGKSPTPAPFTKSVRPGLKLTTAKENRWYQKWATKWAKLCLSVLKPGGYMLVFGYPRTFHRLISGIEDAGFEIRDCLLWIFGAGFPKSVEIASQIAKLKGCKKEEAKNWEGWGTALKPAYEPIVLARKPISEKNLALNILKWNVGALNIKDCKTSSGRFPSHLILECCCEETIKVNNQEFHTNPECPCYQLDASSGILKSGYMSPTLHKRRKTKGEYQSPFGIYGKFKLEYLKETYGDIGGASRFFYQAKTKEDERWFYCKICQQAFHSNHAKKHEHNDGTSIIWHPTQKPLELMKYLVKLVTPPNGIVLDLFCGTGTTLVACKILGFKFIGIEKEKEYVEIANARLKEIPESLF